MPYLGNTPSDVFTQTVKDSFDGDGNTTQFTLSITASTNDCEVFVDNIQQEPTVAYTINGTTLSFNEAPPTGSGNVYVVVRDPAVARSFVSTEYIENTSVTTEKIADNSVTNAKLANDSVEFAEITLTARNGIIKSTGAGQMYIAADSDIFLTSQDFLYTYADFRYGNGVRLFNDNVLTFMTTDSGATVYGNVTATAFYGDGSNLTGVTPASIFPFFKADGTSDTISLINAQMPFFKSDGTQDNIGVS